VPVIRRIIFQRKCDASTRRRIFSPSSATSQLDTRASVEVWPSGFSQNDAKSWSPANCAAAAFIASASSVSLTHQTKGFSKAVRTREIRYS